MTTIRAFFLQIRALFSNFQKREGETSPLPPSSYAPCPTRSSRPEVFCKKGVLRNFAKFTGKHLCHIFFLISCRPEACNFINKETLARVNFAKFLITPFFIEHLWWLLLPYFYLLRLLFDSILHYIYLIVFFPHINKYVSLHRRI